MLGFIDTHIHLDGEEFADDREAVVRRAREAGAVGMFVPAIDLASSRAVIDVCRPHPDFAYPMIGMHPEEVRADWRSQFEGIRKLYREHTDGARKELNPDFNTYSLSASTAHPGASTEAQPRIIAIGEVGLDYYWSREFEHEQLAAFEAHVEWSIESGLPLMIHCRKAQNEMVSLLRRYEGRLPGGVFHCFTGNVREAEEFLRFDGFALGIGGVLTFKKSNLPETLRNIPLERIVLETDAPYMAPVPHRGERNESAFVADIVAKMADVYAVSPEQVARVTTATARRIFFGTDFAEKPM